MMRDQSTSPPPRGAFTLIELLVVIAIIAVLMGILMPALTRAREQGRRAVCMAHLKQMQMSWIMYADDNDDRIVNGNAGESNPGYSTKDCWVQRDYNLTTLKQKKTAIKKGALWPYVGNVKAYHCPTGRISRTELRMFTIMDSMNVKDWTKTGNDVGPGGTTFRKRASIKHGAERAVFFDDGGTGGNTEGGWTVYTTTFRWWDPPPIRHGNGTTWSFADGHVGYLKYSDLRTVRAGKLVDENKWQVGLDAGQGNRDNYQMRLWVWGPIAARSGL